MGIHDWTYGTPEEVASLVPRYTTSGAFGLTSRPTLEQVERYLDRVSGVANTLLAQEGFSTPIKEARAKAAIDELVVEAVIELCHLTNSAGRFFTDRALRAQNPMRAIREELAAWIDEHAAGIENLGAARGTSLAGQIAYRDTDESGDATFPIFQREAFGNRFDNWDQ